MSILDQKAPGLSQQLRALSREQRRRVVAKVCEAVSHSISQLEPGLQALIRSAAERNALSPDEVEELRHYAENADKRCFTLKEEGVDRPACRNWFAKARLATALADGFGSEEWEATADAVYETCFVEEADASVINLVRSVIDSFSKK